MSSGITGTFAKAPCGAPLSLCPRYVIHALLTRPPLNPRNIATTRVPFDLHALATPPAFVLSQDQTLHFLSLHQEDGPVPVRAPSSPTCLLRRSSHTLPTDLSG
jgi:hypothetical protein